MSPFVRRDEVARKKMAILTKIRGLIWSRKNERKEVDALTSAFGRFGVGAQDLHRCALKKVKLTYWLIKVCVTDVATLTRRMTELILLVQNSGCDVNQVLADTMLALNTGPLTGESVQLTRNLVRALATSQDLCVIVRNDECLYGAVGYESRMVVSAFSDMLVRDANSIRGNVLPGLFIDADLLRSLELDQDGGHLHAIGSGEKAPVSG